METVKCLLVLVATHGCSDSCIRAMLGLKRDVNPDKLISDDSMTWVCTLLLETLLMHVHPDMCTNMSRNKLLYYEM